MDQETIINKILSEDLSKETFKRLILELTPREQKILSMSLGLEDGIARNLENVCKKFKITKTQYQRVLRKALKKYLEEIHKPVGAKIGWRYSYLNPSNFSSFEEFKGFVLKLFEKGYKIEKTEYIISSVHRADVPPRFKHLLKLLEGENNMWICNKKAKKCYIFRAITEQEKKFFDDLFLRREKGNSKK